MRRRLFCLAFLAVGIPVLAQAPKSPEPPKSFDLESIDKYVAELVRDKGITGLSLSIARDGKIVFAKGYGKRSREENVPVEPETKFAAGSVTKQFACACILLLAEDGKLSVDDHVAKYFSGLTRGGEITLYQLMTHTSGYPDYYPLDFVDRRLTKPIVIDSLIKEYAGGKLDFEPGTRWSYSNTGYMILGRVVEKVSGVPFGEFLERRILKPAGMTNTVFEPDSSDAGLARGYTPFALELLQPANPEASGWLHAAGGLWSTATDLARWDIALMEGKILNPSSIRLMISPVLLADGRLRDYGCGLSIRRENGAIILAHGGAISGFRASNTLIPQSRSAVVVLINDEQSAPSLTQTILTLMRSGEAAPDAPKISGPAASEVALNFFHQMQSGELDRTTLGEEFSIYLSDERIKASASRLKALGEPEKVEISGIRERGGMEVCSVKLIFKSIVLEGLLYRSPDGKIQQLLFAKGG